MSDLVEFFNDISDHKLSEMREFASRENDNDPILRKNTAALYKFILTLANPKRILEAGTSIGYSALLAYKTLEKLGIGHKIDTIEIDEETARKAVLNFESEGADIHVIVGDSVEVFSCLEGPYDLIFLDSSKAHYIDMLPDVKRLLSPGGILLCDDVVFYGKIYDNPEDAPHKHRTIVARLREFLDAVRNDNDFVSVLDPIDDGFLMAVYKPHLKENDNG